MRPSRPLDPSLVNVTAFVSDTVDLSDVRRLDLIKSKAL